jgi:hypothetical protein
MINVRLCGGLGNQMFQYAAGRAVSLRLGVPLSLDLSWFAAPKGDTPRTYELECFGIRPRPRFAAVHELLGPRPKLLKERGFPFDPAIHAARDGAVLSGSWQSWRYFADCDAEIRCAFSLPQPFDPLDAAVARQIGSAGPASVSLHVRRGDYANSPKTSAHHGVLPVSYYVEAVELVREAAALRSPQLFAFSDDPEWCEANLHLGYPMTIVAHNGPTRGWADLRLMTHCRHHVIANSSFSWWAAWLASNRTGTVVAPKQWFRDPRIDTTDLIPERWYRL